MSHNLWTALDHLAMRVVMEGLWRMHSNMSSRLEALRVKAIIHTKQGYVDLALKTEEYLHFINI